jgi:hypothetical protein
VTAIRVVELRVRSDGAHEFVDLSDIRPPEEVDARRQRFEHALRAEAEKLAATTESGAVGQSAERLAVFLSFNFDDLLVRLLPKSETQSVLYEQVLSDMLHDFESLCRFTMVDVKHVERSNLDPLMSAWADLIVYAESGAPRMVMELTSSRTQLQTSLDAESWSRGVEAISGHKWHRVTLRARQKDSLYRAEDRKGVPASDRPRAGGYEDVPPWERTLATAAEHGDEVAFDQERSRIDWSARSASEFALAARLALRAGAHLAAREIASEGSKRFPTDLQLRKLAHVLAPPEIVRHPTQTPNPALLANMAWLREHGSSYRGLWVALRAGELVASAASAEALREVLRTRERDNSNDVVLTRVA